MHESQYPEGTTNDAGGEQLADAAEAERRRLAQLLQESIVEPLNLLLSQSNAYEQTLGAHPPTRLALSVLSSLARQVLQRARDIEDSLRPTVLDELGLEPALDALASQFRRVYGLQLSLAAERLRDRPSRAVELALFRAAQDALDRAVRHARAQHAGIRLERRDERLILTLDDDGDATAGRETLRAASRRIVQLGGVIEHGTGPRGGLRLAITIAVAPPPELTPRELEVLRLLAEGMSNKAIGVALGVSPRTVNFHLDNIFSKLGVASRTEAVIYALRQGWGWRE
jgi:signal transduction histidine kinase/DNA-binding CsgD family transcriptional regulator